MRSPLSRRADEVSLSHVMPSGRSDWWYDYIQNLRRISRESWWFLLGTMLVSFAWLTFLLLFNLFMKERGYTEGTMGQVLSSQSLGTMAMALPAAYLVSRLSARTALVLSSLGLAFGFFWATTASHTSLIIIGAFTAGTMLAFSRVWSSPFLMRHSSPSERAHVFSLAFAASLGSGLIAHLGAGSLHRFLTPVAGSALVAYQWVLWMGAGCAVLGALAFMRIPHEVIVEQRERRSLKLILRTKGPLFFRLVFPSFLVGLGAGLIIPFLNLYFRDRFGLSTQTIGVYYALVQASMILGVMIGPELARRYGMVRTIVLSELASLPFMVILAFTKNLPMATAAFLARGALMNLGVPIANNYLMERVGAEDRGTGNSLALLAWTSSWAIAAIFGGWMIEKSGYELPLLLASALYLLSSGMYYFYFRNEEMHAGRQAEGVLAVEAIE